MRSFTAALTLAAAMGLGAAQAQNAPVVVELFTSQGCSSCPPAESLLTELAARDDVIALALHVDYWDYIGWKDTFGDPKFTTRQKGYARAAGYRTIYTPQMIVGGQDHVVGYKPMRLAELIEEHKKKPDRVALTLTREGEVLTIRAEALGPLPSKMLVQLVRYLPEGTVEIESGENAGKTMVNANIVTDWEMIGGWDGSGPLLLQVDAPGEAPTVVIVQVPGQGAILAAARLD